MNKIVKKLISGAFIVVLASAMLFTATEIGVVVNNEPMVLEALGSDGYGESTYVPPAAPVRPAKKANPISVSGEIYKIDYKKLLNKGQTIKKSDAFSIYYAKGTVSFSKNSGNKSITISKNGVITVKKGLKAGKYPLKVNVYASGNSSYKAASRTATVTIKVITSDNPIIVSGNSVTLSGDKLAAGKQTIDKKKALTVKNAKGTVTFKKVKGSDQILVNKSTGKITVKSGLKPGKQYSVKVKVTAAGNNNYKSGSETATVTIKVTAVKNPVTASGKTVVVSGDELAKAKQTIERKKAITIKNAKGTVTYSKTKGSDSILVNKTTGNITVKSGLKPGDYTVKVKVTAAGNTSYKKGSSTASVVIKVTEVTSPEDTENDAQAPAEGDSAATGTEG